MNNKSGFIDNEYSIKAQGGTEIAKKMLTGLLDPALLDNFQIISSRPRELDESKIRVLFAHDLAHDPEVAGLRDPNFRNRFHKLVFISNWQYQQYQTILGVPYDGKSIVIESGIDPVNMDIKNKPRDVVNLIYTSTPQRGLGLLVPVFEKLQETQKDIHLHVFSSFKIYGWDDKDKEFEPLYEMCKSRAGISYRGFVPHDELLEFLKQCHIFAYPCVWPETSCRSMLEAMSAGLLCVHPNFAGLPDTSGGLNLIYPGTVDPNHHANIFAGALNSAIELVKENSEQTQFRLIFNKQFVDFRFNINKIKTQWEFLLKELLNLYPTPESRQFAKPVFTYNTNPQ